jgi:hypothetical protein
MRLMSVRGGGGARRRRVRTAVAGSRRSRGSRGLGELHRERSGEQEPPAAGRSRRAGAGRKRMTEADPTVLEDLERLVDPATRGDPERPLRYTSKSAAKLADGLRELGHELVDRSVARGCRSS